MIRIGKLFAVSYLNKCIRSRKYRMYSSTSNASFQRAILAIGGNMGDRYGMIQKALMLIQSYNDTRLTDTSYLYESESMYVLDQPHFLNGVLAIETSLDPIMLLHRVKDIERACGRKISNDTGAGLVPNGPRPIDIDILFYGNRNDAVIDNTNPNLIVPHPRLQERSFVTTPLLDLHNSNLSQHPLNGETFRDIHQYLIETKTDSTVTLNRVIPLPRERFICFDRSIIMGILNSTPDSFSDGGQVSSAFY